MLKHEILMIVVQTLIMTRNLAAANCLRISILRFKVLKNMGLLATSALLTIVK